MRVSLGFFEDVLVPEANLQEPSVYISEEGGTGVWRWDFDGTHLFLDHGEEVMSQQTRWRRPACYDPSMRFVCEFLATSLLNMPSVVLQVRIKVREVRYNPIPTPTQMKEGGLGTPALPYKPMLIIADMNLDGLGAVSWWQGCLEDGE